MVNKHNVRHEEWEWCKKKYIKKKQSERKIRKCLRESGRKCRFEREIFNRSLINITFEEWYTYSLTPKHWTNKCKLYWQSKESEYIIKTSYPNSDHYSKFPCCIFHSTYQFASKNAHITLLIIFLFNNYAFIDFNPESLIFLQ